MLCTLVHQRASLTSLTVTNCERMNDFGESGLTDVLLEKLAQSCPRLETLCLKVSASGAGLIARVPS